METTAARRALALPKDALELHNRVGGRPLAAGEARGWLFTGREELMHDLIRATRTPGVTMVTGSAGCGKSIALSRLVTLSDPEFRGQYAGELVNIPPHMRPAHGAVRLAVSARKKSNEELLAQMCHLLDIQVRARRSGNAVMAYWHALSEYVAGAAGTTGDHRHRRAGRGQRRVKSRQERARPAPAGSIRERLCLLIGVRSPGGYGVTVGDVTVAEEPLPDLVSDGARSAADPGRPCTLVGSGRC